jgi:hypothetical protein
MNWRDILSTLPLQRQYEYSAHSVTICFCQMCNLARQAQSTSSFEGSGSREPGLLGYSPSGLFSDRLHQVLRLLILPTKLRLFYFYNNCDITFLTMFIPTHPVNFPCGRKPEQPEKTHDFRQSVDSHESTWAHSENRTYTISEVKGACSDDCTTEAPWCNVRVDRK